MNTDCEIKRSYWSIVLAMGFGIIGGGILSHLEFFKSGWFGVMLIMVFVPGIIYKILMR